jgi:hypothetical protein
VDAATRTTLKRFEEAGQPEDNIIDLIVVEYEIPLQFVNGSDSIVSASVLYLRLLLIMPCRRFDTNTAQERCCIADNENYDQKRMTRWCIMGGFDPGSSFYGFLDE